MNEIRMRIEVHSLIKYALDQLGPSRAVLTRGMVEAQVAAAERQFLDGVKCTEFARARQAWGRERDEILAQKFPEWFKARERKEAGLFGGGR